MAGKHSNLIYAVKDGKVIHISAVESGLSCGCTCPACGESLVAKKGQKMMHHFAHKSGSDCEYGYETSLHLAAKEILREAKQFKIPAVYVEFPESYKEKEKISDERIIPIDDVALEQRCGDVVPDIVINSKGQTLFVEIFVTHKVDDDKLEKIRKQGISTIEIDLSSLDEDLVYENRPDILINNCDLKAWVYNSFAQKQLNRFFEVADQGLIGFNGEEWVEGCPLELKRLDGETPYARAFYECLECEFCVKYTREYVLCTGKKYISKMKDFDDPDYIRGAKLKNRVNYIKKKKISKGRCPDCGRRLYIRDGYRGQFIGCSGYPDCKFTTDLKQ